MKEQKLEAFKRCMSLYCSWFESERGFKARIDASDGKGLKETVAYLFSLTPDTDSVVNMFEYILRHWSELSDFYQKGVRLRQINSNLVNIIDSFKNGQTTNKSGISADYLQRVVRDMHDSERGN